MLFILNPSEGKPEPITLRKQLDTMLEGYVLDPREELTLMRMIGDEEERVFARLEPHRLVAAVTLNTPGGKLSSEDRDERGNLTLATLCETEIALNPFFNENYALNELQKLMRRALQDGVLEPSFKSIQLTYHDVPTTQRGHWMNVRTFTGEVMYPRITKRYLLRHRAERKAREQTTLSEKDYLVFRKTFLEPTSPDQPTRRGRKEVSVQHDIDFSRPGILAPEIERELDLPPITIPSPLERREPGKVQFESPDPQDKKLMNDAEDRRRKLDFPFGAGPSGSMAYDMAVYAYYLRHWKKLDPKSTVSREMMQMFGISRAIGYVKYGHHSLYEALVTLTEYFDPDVFASPEALYRYIVAFLEIGLRDRRPKYVDEKTYKHVDSLAVHWDAYLGDWLDWRSYNPDNYRPWTITCKDGAPAGLLGKPIPPGKYIYVILVLDRSVRYLPTTPSGEQYRSHSQLAGGLSVLAAGYFQVADKLGHDDKPALAWIDNSSGHYKPSRDSVDYARKKLGKLGFDVGVAKAKKFAPTAADSAWGPWLKQQALGNARIIKGQLVKTPGRTRSFPEPPSELLQYMPY